MTTLETRTQSLNIPLLDRLRDAAGGYVPFDQLGVDSARTHQDLSALVEFGFGIEHHPHHGVAYRFASDRLCPDQLEFGLETRVIGRRIAVWNRVASTNDLAARAAHCVSNDGLVVMAEEQWAGRGRRGRDWVAPARSSILMSVLLFPPESLTTDHHESSTGTRLLTALAAVAVAETVSNLTHAEAQIKWPNDVRVAGRKIAGILVERPAIRRPTDSRTREFGSALQPVRPAVIGIGLNVNITPDHFPPSLANSATSLQVETPRHEPLDRSEVARDLLRRLDRWYDVCISDGLEKLSEAWSAASEHLGRTMHADTLDGSYVGVITELDLHRGLTLSDARSALPDVERASRSSLRFPLERILSLSPSSAGDPLPAASSESQQPPGDLRGER